VGEEIGYLSASVLEVLPCSRKWDFLTVVKGIVRGWRFKGSMGKVRIKWRRLKGW